MCCKLMRIRSCRPKFSPQPPQQFGGDGDDEAAAAAAALVAQLSAANDSKALLEALAALPQVRFSALWLASEATLKSFGCDMVTQLSAANDTKGRSLRCPRCSTHNVETQAAGACNDQVSQCFTSNTPVLHLQKDAVIWFVDCRQLLGELCAPLMLPSA